MTTYRITIDADSEQAAEDKIAVGDFKMEQVDLTAESNLVHRECFARLLVQTQPGDPSRSLVVIVKRGESGYYNIKDTRYANEDELAELNREIYGVEPDEAEEISAESFRLSSMKSAADDHLAKAKRMYAALRMIFDQGDEPRYLDLEELLYDMEDYAEES